MKNGENHVTLRAAMLRAGAIRQADPDTGAALEAGITQLALRAGEPVLRMDPMGHTIAKQRFAQWVTGGRRVVDFDDRSWAERHAAE